MKEMGAFEAKNRFGQLLDWVEAGEEVIITRRGKTVARLVQPAKEFDPELGVRTVREIREMRKGVTLGGLPIRDLIDEGRK